MTDVPEMVERVVDAMLATELDVVMWGRQTVRELAVAAIAAMREPTEEMIAEGAHTDGRYTAIEVWIAMIDEALGKSK